MNQLLDGSPRRWRPAWGVSASLLLHLVLLALVSARPALWPWLLVVLIADHLLICGLVMWPRSRAIGNNLLRLPPAAVARHEVAITFDDGPDPEVTPRVLDWLARYDARASFFCPAERAAAQPELIREILRRGHQVENHSWRHSPVFACFGWWRLRRELNMSQDILTRLTGCRPVFFRAPIGFRNPMLDPLLASSGLHLVTWTRRAGDGLFGNPRWALRRLQSRLAAGDILLLHDGGSTPTVEGEPVVLVVLPQLLQRCQELGLRPVALRTGVAA